MEIPKAEALEQAVFSISGAAGFEALALQLFRFQYHHNPVYRSYCDLLVKDPEHVNRLEAIPFLPIQFFKTHTVAATVCEPQIIFESSGTTGAQTSRHLVKNAALYRQSFRSAFRQFYGDPGRYCVLGLLPSYLERQHSSLVYMVDDLIRGTRHGESGFYLYDFGRLAATLQRLEGAGQPALLIGVTYALLDFAERFPMPLRHTVVMETGGMKGRRRELLRTEVHQLLQHAFNLPAVHSEYGMTELLSQAYAQQEGRFRAPPWMKVLVREEDDPFCYLPPGKTGALNLIDLANIHSCSFIASEDIGKRWEDGSFTVEGRLDQAGVRGCSLLYV